MVGIFIPSFTVLLVIRVCFLSGVYAGARNKDMWSDWPRCGSWITLKPFLMLKYALSKVLIFLIAHCTDVTFNFYRITVFRSAWFKPLVITCINSHNTDTHQSLTGLSVQNCSLIYMVLSGLRWPESSVLFDQTKELSFSVPWSLAYTFWQIPGKISYEHCFSSSGYSLLLFHIALTIWWRTLGNICCCSLSYQSQ